jgi:hypothetical protein
MALAVNRTGVILKKRDMSYHRPASVERCATATYQSTWPGNTIERCPRARRPARRRGAGQVRRFFDPRWPGCGPLAPSSRSRCYGVAVLRVAPWQPEPGDACPVTQAAGGLGSLLIGVTAEFDCIQLD